MAGTLVETARAKINLTLRILGRRPDGYHEVSSLVAFAGIGDRLTLDPGPGLALEVAGAGAGAVSATDNLVLRAAEAARAAGPHLTLGRFRLEKTLPVAAGIGGGSADAAAALRLVQAANAGDCDDLDWKGLAASLGADVPVCLLGSPALMTGIGEKLTPLAPLPPCWIVLANPGVPLSTASVFRALEAPPLGGTSAAGQPTRFASFRGLIEALHAHANDMEPAALRLCPGVAVVGKALAGLSGAAIARMSGSGPTCFALFEKADDAVAGAEALTAAHPGWWIRAAPLS